MRNAPVAHEVRESVEAWSPSPLSSRQRLWASVALGFLAAFVSLVNAMSPRHRDFTVVWQAAQALLHGQAVYTAVPGLLYPLPGIVAAVPFAVLSPAPLACGLFMLLGATAFAWALTAHGWSALIGFASAGMYVAAVWVQWSPLFAGAFAVAPLGVFLVVKPHTGLPILLARPSWWAIGSGQIPTPANIEEAHAFMREELIERFGADGQHIRLLYGGSVNGDNAADLLAIANVNGLLVGGHSLKAVDFLAICEAYHAL